MYICVYILYLVYIKNASHALQEASGEAACCRLAVEAFDDATAAVTIHIIAEGELTRPPAYRVHTPLAQSAENTPGCSICCLLL